MMDAIIGRIWQLRQVEAGWSEKTQLPHYQKIWLDALFTQEREKDDSWLVLVIHDCVFWFIDGYKKIMSKEAKVLSEEVVHQIKCLIEKHQDGLR